MEPFTKPQTLIGEREHLFSPGVCGDLPEQINRNGCFLIKSALAGVVLKAATAVLAPHWPALGTWYTNSQAPPRDAIPKYTFKKTHERPDYSPESLVRGLLGAWGPVWPPGLGEECREMKDGSLQRLLEPVPELVPPVPEAASSWSKKGVEELAEGEEEGEKAVVAFEDRVEVEANTLGERGGEDRASVLEARLLGICLTGR